MAKIEKYIKNEGSCYEKRMAYNTVIVELENFKDKALNIEELIETIQNEYGEGAYYEDNYIMYAFDKAVIFDSFIEMNKCIQEFQTSISELISNQMKVNIRLRNTGEHEG